MPSRAEPIEEKKEGRNTHGFLLKCQPPACQGIPVATTDRSGWTQCQAEKTGDIEQTTRGQDNKKKKNKERSNPSKRTKMRGTTRTPPGNFRHFATSSIEGHSCSMARTTCHCLRHREGASTREKQQKS